MRHETGFLGLATAKVHSTRTADGSTCLALDLQVYPTPGSRGSGSLDHTGENRNIRRH